MNYHLRCEYGVFTILRNMIQNGVIGEGQRVSLADDLVEHDKLWIKATHGTPRLEGSGSSLEITPLSL